MILRNLIVCISLMAVLVSPVANAFNIYRVGEIVEGRSYNDLMKRWSKRGFSIWVGISESKTPYIFFKGDTGINTASVSVIDSVEVRDKLFSDVAKAISWSEIAKSNNADTSKRLSCFGSDPYDLCRDGGAFDTNQMSLSFFSANGGKQTDLIIKIIDRDNQFYKESIYLDQKAMNKLLSVIERIDDAMAKARETLNKQDLFK